MRAPHPAFGHLLPVLTGDIEDGNRDLVTFVEEDRGKVVAREFITLHYVGYKDGGDVIESHQMAGETSKDGYNQDREDTKARCEQYKAARLDEQDQEYERPNGIFADWQALVTNPIPA